MSLKSRSAGQPCRGWGCMKKAVSVISLPEVPASTILSSPPPPFHPPPSATSSEKILAVIAMPPATRNVPQPTFIRCSTNSVPPGPGGISLHNSFKTAIVVGAGAFRLHPNCTLRAKLSGLEMVVATPAATKSAQKWAACKAEVPVCWQVAA